MTSNKHLIIKVCVKKQYMVWPSGFVGHDHDRFLYSLKTKDGWVLVNCPRKLFNRPPQVGMCVRFLKNKKMYEVCGRSGR